MPEHAIAVQIEEQKTRAELRRLWAEFKQTPPGSPERQNRVERIDGLLDARLEQRGAHKGGLWLLGVQHACGGRAGRSQVGRDDGSAGRRDRGPLVSFIPGRTYHVR